MKVYITREEKLKHWGDGEWLDEDDFLVFDCSGYKCYIIRVANRDGPNGTHLFGGHLCGYVVIPKDHPYYEKNVFDEELNIECHCGLNFSKFNDNSEWMIGFDCAHSVDYVPSIEHFKKTKDKMIDFNKIFPIPEGFENFAMFNPVYRNMDYCIEQCKSIVGQLIEVKNE